MLFSACRGGSNPDEIIEVIDNPNEPPTVPTVMITVGNDYTGSIKVNYLEKPASTSTTTKTISGTVADGAVQLASYPPRGSLIVSIQAGAGTNPPIHYIGRLIGSSAISLKLKLNNLGNIELRPADSESNKIPIGIYEIETMAWFYITACYWKANGASSPSSDSTGYTEITGNFFTPPSTGEWGTGDGSESGKYWKANVDYTENLPKLWYEE
ncbi:MAG: hypothetical protein Ta2F_13140 [Termitinemataceae bacterium]|nr:MAG: hypothetical protein Ta2F_13140 [Termitinemataceae bacterium]